MLSRWFKCTVIYNEGALDWLKDTNYLQRYIFCVNTALWLWNKTYMESCKNVLYPRKRTRVGMKLYLKVLCPFLLAVATLYYALPKPFKKYLLDVGHVGDLVLQPSLYIKYTKWQLKQLLE